MTRTERLLAELVALPSVNPSFAPLDGSSARKVHRSLFGEKNVADFLASVAARAGLEVEFQEVLPGRSNLIARLLPKKGSRQTIILAPHLDTVGAEESQFIPRRKNGRLYGRGACDTKGSVAAMLAALCELANSKTRPLETDYAARLRKRRHPLLGTGTVNVGAICGGTQPNIVPDRCVITIDRRTLPGETDSGVQREVLAFLRSNRLQARISSTKMAPALPLETDPRLPLVRHFLHSIGQRRMIGVDFFCDAAVLSAGGISSIVFGPGDIAQAHTTDEWISLASLERGKNLLLRFLNSLP